MKIVKVLLGLVVCLSAIVVTMMGVLYGQTFFSSPNGKYTVAMAGRSVTDQWFKYRNWPALLSQFSVYRPWPIPYKKYVQDGFYLEYIPIGAPGAKGEYGYGEKMLDTMRGQLKDREFDALFFKLCFVDFGDKNVTDGVLLQSRLEQMTSLVERIHAYTQERKMRLILGNSLPAQNPGEYAQQLRIEFNSWVERYVSSNQDVAMIDLFHSLSDANGALRKDFAREADDLSDSHLNNTAYKTLDKVFFAKLKQLPKP